MKHAMTMTTFIVVLLLGAILTALVVLRAGLTPMNQEDAWTPPDDEGSLIVDGEEDEGAPGEIASLSGNIVVTSPQSGEVLGLPLVVTGRARVFESTFNYRLLDEDGTVLVEGYAMANAPDIGMFGDFTVTTSYGAPSGTIGTVEVFDYSAKDGSVIDLVQIPVVFPTMTSMEVEVFWTTAASAENCAYTESTVHRVAASPAVAYAALAQLLAGPDTTDVSRGYATSIPLFTMLKSITIDSGVATATFSSAIEAGGSCRVTSIRSQIESTLLKFPTVSSVVIQTEGMTPEESLQP